MIDLTKLKIGATVYSTVGGECKVAQIVDIENRNIAPKYPIMIKYSSKNTSDSYTKEGKLYASLNGECLLFPSKECRDWNLYDFETGTIKDAPKASNTKKVVFKGDKDRGDDIIQYLEELGGYNKYNMSAANPNIYYFVDENTIINCLEPSLHYLIEDSHELLTLSPKFNDKDLVWCWFDDSLCERVLRFYDAIHNCTFRNTGEREGYYYDRYEPYIGEYPEWAKEAIKLLED